MIPAAVIIAGATELVKLGVEVWEAHANGATEDELNQKWNSMQARLRAADARWQAAGSVPPAGSTTEASKPSDA
jgi:hypothetical protein